MKKIIMTIAVALVCSLAIGQVVRTISIAVGTTSGTWVNETGRKDNVKLSSLFGTLSAGATANDTVTVTVEHDGTTYTVDTGSVTSNGTTVAVDFDKTVYAPWGSTTTVTRTANSTNAALSIMLVTE